MSIMKYALRRLTDEVQPIWILTTSVSLLMAAVCVVFVSMPSGHIVGQISA